MDLSLEGGEQGDCGRVKDNVDDMSLDSQNHYANGASSAVCCGVDLDLASPLSSSPQNEEAAGACKIPPSADNYASNTAVPAQATPASDPGGGGINYSSASSEDDSSRNSSRRVFRNRGFELWVESRKAWKKYPDAAGKGEGADAEGDAADNNTASGRSPTLSPASTSAASTDICGTSDSAGSNGSGGRFGAAALEGLSPDQAEAVLRGLTRVTRTYQLPRKVALPDMVDLLNEIWECERDY